MIRRYRWASTALTSALAVAALSCGTPNTPLPSFQESPNDRREIVAFVNGEPVTRREVMEMSFKWHEKENIEEYIAWKLIRQKRNTLGVVNSPEELGRRADLALQNIKADFGDASFEQYLRERKITEQDLKAVWLREGNIDAKLANEKMVLYTQITEETIEADMLLFPREEDAKDFLKRLGNHEDRFDVERSVIPESAQARFVQLKAFPRGMAPDFIDDKAEEAIFALRAGDVSNPIFCNSGYLVVRVKSKSAGRSGTYEQLKDEILKRIFQHPPDDETIGRWIKRLRKRGDIRYERRDPKGN